MTTLSMKTLGSLLMISTLAMGCAASDGSGDDGESEDTSEALGAYARYETEVWANSSGAQRRFADAHASGGRAIEMTTNGVIVTGYDVSKTRRKHFYVAARGTRCDGQAAKLNLVIVRPDGTRDGVQASGLDAPRDGSYPLIDMGVIQVHKGKGQIAIEFPNDKFDPAAHCDRNLTIDYVATRNVD